MLLPFCENGVASLARVTLRLWGALTPAPASIAIAINTNPSRDRMGKHLFDIALSLGHRAYFPTRRGGHTLIGAGLEKLPDPDATGVARSPAGGKNVVGANGLIPIRNGGLLTDEQ